MRAAITGQSPFELGKPDNCGKIQLAQSLDFLRLPGLDPDQIWSDVLIEIVLGQGHQRGLVTMGADG
jgi:hypothetical protein